MNALHCFGCRLLSPMLLSFVWRTRATHSHKIIIRAHARAHNTTNGAMRTQWETPAKQRSSRPRTPADPKNVHMQTANALFALSDVAKSTEFAVTFNSPSIRCYSPPKRTYRIDETDAADKSDCFSVDTNFHFFFGTRTATRGENLRISQN